jgi:hypothetical protein
MPAHAQDAAAPDLTVQLNGYERAAHAPFVGTPTDWSSKHLVFSPAEPGSEPEGKVQQDPRYWLQQIRQGQAASDSIGQDSGDGELSEGAQTNEKKTKAKKAKIKKDWSENLGTNATVGAGQYPAKFTFSTTTASCAAPGPPDFVVYNTGLAGSGTQATIIAFDNLYSGCSGIKPTAYWRYNTAFPQGSATGDGSAITTAVVLSQDGSQVAFVQSNSSGVASLVMLKWKSSAALVQLDTAATNVTNAAYRTCTAPCMTRITFNGSHNDSHSAPFYDYTPGSDTLYVGEDPLTTGSTSQLHKFTGVFLGSPAEEVANGWPVVVASAQLAGPTYDANSKIVFVTASYDGAGNGARLHAVAQTSTTTSVTNSIQLGPTANPGTALTVDSPIVDSTAEQVYVFIGSDAVLGGGTTSGGGNALVYQFPTGNITGATPTTVAVGSGTSSGIELFDGDFDNGWSTTETGHLYVCGNTGGAPTLYQIPITSGIMGTTSAAIKALTSTTTTTSCSPVTEFFNSPTDWLFMSVTALGNLSTCTGACVYSFNATTSTSVTNAGGIASAGGSSGIVVDNSASSPAGASQVYFSTLSNQTCVTTGGTGGCAIQAAQSGL